MAFIPYAVEGLPLLAEGIGSVVGSQYLSEMMSGGKFDDDKLPVDYGLRQINNHFQSASPHLNNTKLIWARRGQRLDEDMPSAVHGFTLKDDQKHQFQNAAQFANFTVVSLPTFDLADAGTVNILGRTSAPGSPFDYWQTFTASPGRETAESYDQPECMDFIMRGIHEDWDTNSARNGHLFFSMAIFPTVYADNESASVIVRPYFVCYANFKPTAKSILHEPVWETIYPSYANGGSIELDVTYIKANSAIDSRESLIASINLVRPELGTYIWIMPADRESCVAGFDMVGYNIGIRQNPETDKDYFDKYTVMDFDQEAPLAVTLPEDHQDYEFLFRTVPRAFGLEGASLGLATAACLLNMPRVAYTGFVKMLSPHWLPNSELPKAKKPVRAVDPKINRSYPGLVDRERYEDASELNAAQKLRERIIDSKSGIGAYGGDHQSMGDALIALTGYCGKLGVTDAPGSEGMPLTSGGTAENHKLYNVMTKYYNLNDNSYSKTRSGRFFSDDNTLVAKGSDEVAEVELLSFKTRWAIDTHFPLIIPHTVDMNRPIIDFLQNTTTSGKDFLMNIVPFAYSMVESERGVQYQSTSSPVLIANTITQAGTLAFYVWATFRSDTQNHSSYVEGIDTEARPTDYKRLLEYNKDKDGYSAIEHGLMKDADVALKGGKVSKTKQKSHEGKMKEQHEMPYMLTKDDLHRRDRKYRDVIKRQTGRSMRDLPPDIAGALIVHPSANDQEDDYDDEDDDPDIDTGYPPSMVSTVRLPSRSTSLAPTLALSSRDRSEPQYDYDEDYEPLPPQRSKAKRGTGKRYETDVSDSIASRVRESRRDRVPGNNIYYKSRAAGHHRGHSNTSSCTSKRSSCSSRTASPRSSTKKKRRNKSASSASSKSRSRSTSVASSSGNSSRYTTIRKSIAATASKALKNKKGLKSKRSPFIIFSNTFRAKLRSDHPDWPMTKIAVKLGELWRGMSTAEKAKYGTSVDRPEGGTIVGVQSSGRYTKTNNAFLNARRNMSSIPNKLAVGSVNRSIGPHTAALYHGHLSVSEAPTRYTAKSDGFFDTMKHFATGPIGQFGPAGVGALAMLHGQNPFNAVKSQFVPSEVEQLHIREALGDRIESMSKKPIVKHIENKLAYIAPSVSQKISQLTPVAVNKIAERVSQLPQSTKEHIASLAAPRPQTTSSGGKWRKQRHTNRRGNSAQSASTFGKIAAGLGALALAGLMAKSTYDAQRHGEAENNVDSIFEQQLPDTTAKSLKHHKYNVRDLVPVKDMFAKLRNSVFQTPIKNHIDHINGFPLTEEEYNAFKYLFFLEPYFSVYPSFSRVLSTGGLRVDNPVAKQKLHWMKNVTNNGENMGKLYNELVLQVVKVPKVGQGVLLDLYMSMPTILKAYSQAKMHTAQAEHSVQSGGFFSDINKKILQVGGLILLSSIMFRAGGANAQNDLKEANRTIEVAQNFNYSMKALIDDLDRKMKVTQELMDTPEWQSKDVEGMRQRFLELTQQHATTEAEYEQLKHHMVNVMDVGWDQYEELKQARAQIEAMAQQLGRAQVDIEASGKDESERTHAELKKMEDGLNSIVAILDIDVFSPNAIDKIEGIRQAVEKNQQQQGTQSDLVESLRAELQRALNLNSEISQLSVAQRAELESRLSGDISNIHQHYAGLEQEHRRLQGRHGDLEREYGQLEQHHRGIEREYGQLQHQYSGLQSMHSQVLAQYEKRGGQIKQLERDAGNARQMHEMTAQSVQALQNENAILMDKIKSVQHGTQLAIGTREEQHALSVSQMYKHIEENEQQIMVLEDKYRSIESELMKTRQELMATKVRSEAFANLINLIHTASQQARESTLIEISEQEALLRSMLATDESPDSPNLNAKLTYIVETLNVMKQVNAEAEERMHRLDMQKNDLKIYNDQLMQQNKDLDNQLKVSTQQAEITIMQLHQKAQDAQEQLANEAEGMGHELEVATKRSNLLKMDLFQTETALKDLQHSEEGLKKRIQKLKAIHKKRHDLSREHKRENFVQHKSLEKGQTISDKITKMVSHHLKRKKREINEKVKREASAERRALALLDHEPNTRNMNAAVTFGGSAGTQSGWSRPQSTFGSGMSRPLTSYSNQTSLLPSTPSGSKPFGMGMSKWAALAALGLGFGVFADRMADKYGGYEKLDEIKQQLVDLYKKWKVKVKGDAKWISLYAYSVLKSIIIAAGGDMWAGVKMYADMSGHSDLKTFAQDMERHNNINRAFEEKINKVMMKVAHASAEGLREEELADGTTMSEKEQESRLLAYITLCKLIMQKTFGSEPLDSYIRQLQTDVLISQMGITLNEAGYEFVRRVEEYAPGTVDPNKMYMAEGGNVTGVHNWRQSDTSSRVHVVPEDEVHISEVSEDEYTPRDTSGRTVPDNVLYIASSASRSGSSRSNSRNNRKRYRGRKAAGSFGGFSNFGGSLIGKLSSHASEFASHAGKFATTHGPTVKTGLGHLGTAGGKLIDVSGRALRGFEQSTPLVQQMTLQALQTLTQSDEAAKVEEQQAQNEIRRMELMNRRNQFQIEQEEKAFEEERQRVQAEREARLAMDESDREESPDVTQEHITQSQGSTGDNLTSGASGSYSTDAESGSDRSSYDGRSNSSSHGRKRRRRYSSSSARSASTASYYSNSSGGHPESILRRGRHYRRNHKHVKFSAAARRKGTRHWTLHDKKIHQKIKNREGTPYPRRRR